MSAIPAIQTIPISSLDEASDNENVMTAEQFDMLCEAIRSVGFLQPILVEQAGDRWRIVDGAHRKRAAEQVGLTELPCVVRDPADNRQVAVRIGMNKLRGQLDLAAVATSVANLHAEGWSVEDLSLTGFTTDELNHLLKSAHDMTEEDILSAPADVPDEPEDPVERPFVLELRFATKQELARAKRGLRKAVGRGGDLAEGLIRLLDGA